MSQHDLLEASSFSAAASASIDFEEWRFLKRKNNLEPVWWVVMLINTNRGGHTQLQKTKDPGELLDRLPIVENGKSWEIGMFVRIGANSAAADAFIQVVSGSNSKQIRGIISRAAMVQLLVEKYGFRAYGDFNNIFCVDDAEKLLEKRPL